MPCLFVVCPPPSAAVAGPWGPGGQRQGFVLSAACHWCWYSLVPCCCHLRHAAWLRLCISKLSDMRPGMLSAYFGSSSPLEGVADGGVACQGMERRLCESPASSVSPSAPSSRLERSMYVSHERRQPELFQGILYPAHHPRVLALELGLEFHVFVIVHHGQVLARAGDCI